MKAIKTIIAAAFAALALPVCAEQSITFSYYNPEAKLKNHGYNVTEMYDVGIKLTNPAFVGARIKSIRVPVVDSENVTDYSVWASTELNSIDSGGVTSFYPNECIQDATPVDGYLDVELTRDVRVPAEGLYVGYSFNVKSQSKYAEQYPVLVENATGVKDGLWIHTANWWSVWKDISPTWNMIAAIEVTLEGDFTPAGAIPNNLTNLFGIKNQRLTGTFDIMNVGQEDIKSVDYTVSFNGDVNEQHIDFSNPIAGAYGSSATVDFDLPCGNISGTYPLQISINKVNGQDNSADGKSVTADAMVCSYRPIHRPLFEEFTGTWCGACTRGLAAIEYLNEIGYDKSVIISYHGGNDPMKIANMPELTNSYPKAFLDRKVDCDPYYGTPNATGPLPTIQYDINLLAEEFSPIDVAAQANWTDDDKTAIEIIGSALFVADPKGKYVFNYTLLEDGVHGPEDNPLWSQSNYDSNNPTLAGKPGLAKFKDLPGKIPGYVYYDVAVFNAGENGVAGSIPDERQLDTPYEHTFTIDLADCVSDCQGNKGQDLIQDKERLSVAVQVMDVTDPKHVTIVNSIKVKVPGVASVDEVKTGALPVSETWYDLSGRRVANPGHGIYVKNVRYSDGTVKASKVAIQ